MTMTYSTLIDLKTVNGSIKSWVNYSKLDVETVLSDAQSLLFDFLRTREMRTTWTFGMAVGNSEIALPSRFLEPIGWLKDRTNNLRLRQIIEGDLSSRRVFDETTGTFGASAFTTVTGSTLVSCVDVAHGLTQGSVITIDGSSATGGLTLDGTWPVTSITDDDTFVIDAGERATSAETGGGAAPTWTAATLSSGFPTFWAIHDEMVQFDVAFDTATSFQLAYYRQPELLSTDNETNWLTERYPLLLRKACQAQAADFMKDGEEYNKCIQVLTTMAAKVNENADASYRGAEFGTETP
jgi:hypothetical protein